MRTINILRKILVAFPPVPALRSKRFKSTPLSGPMNNSPDFLSPGGACAPSSASNSREAAPLFPVAYNVVRRVIGFASTAPTGDIGRGLVKSFADDTFVTCWADAHSRATADLEEAKRNISRLEGERTAAARRRENVAEQLPSEAVRLSLPQGWVARTAFTFWLFVLLALSAFTVFNTSNLVLFVLQDVTRAICFSAPLLIIPIGLKLSVGGALRSNAFFKSPWVALGLAFAGAAFAWQVGQNFGHSRSIEEIAEGGGLISRDWRGLLWASIALETIGGLLIWSHIAGFIVRRQATEPNPEYMSLTQQLATLDERLNTESRILYKRQGELEAWSKAQASFAQLALASHRLFEDRAQLIAANNQALDKLIQTWAPQPNRVLAARN